MQPWIHPFGKGLKRFDTSGYLKDDNRSPPTGKYKKVIEMMKDEFGGKIVTKFVALRILIGKKHPKIKLQRLRKMRIWTSGLLVHQINSF